MRSGRKSVDNADPFVEHKTFPPPKAFLRGDGLQIFEDAALEVINGLNALGF